MNEILYQWLHNSHIPFISALLLGLLTAIAPCPLATNITATAYIAKTIKSRKKIVLSGLLYTLGRMFSYTLIAALIYFGASKFHVAKLFQGSGEKYLGFLMVILGLIMLDILKLHFISGGRLTEKFSDTFKDKGFLGSFLLGAFFAMAFCPYSGALFFGMLMPLTIQAGLHLPLAYSMGTGLPVVLFAIVIAYSIQKLGLYFKVITQIEKVMRILAGVIFILTGLYYINMYFNII